MQNKWISTPVVLEGIGLKNYSIQQKILYLCFKKTSENRQLKRRESRKLGNKKTISLNRQLRQIIHLLYIALNQLQQASMIRWDKKSQDCKN